MTIFILISFKTQRILVKHQKCLPFWLGRVTAFMHWSKCLSFDHSIDQGIAFSIILHVVHCFLTFYYAYCNFFSISWMLWNLFFVFPSVLGYLIRLRRKMDISSCHYQHKRSQPVFSCLVAGTFTNQSNGLFIPHTQVMQN